MRKPLTIHEWITIMLGLIFLLPICCCIIPYMVLSMVENRRDNIEISYSGQINGEFEATGVIKCLLIDGNKVPFLSFLASEGDHYNQIAIYLVPDITTGKYQFSNQSIRGNSILFQALLYGDNAPFLEMEDLISGELILKRLPHSRGGMVEGEFSVIYPNITIEGTFKFLADSDNAPNNAPFDCVR